MRVFVYEYLCGSVTDLAAPDLLAAGRVMRDALVADLSALEGVAVSYACATPASAIDAADGPWRHARGVCPSVQESPEAFVRRVAAEHDFAWIIAPECDGLLARLAAVVEPRRWIGCTAAALHLCGRKRATVARLAAHGLVTPLAFDGAVSSWIVKPDDGAGCQRTRRHETHAAAHADLHARRARGEPATLEPYVTGETLSLSLLCGANGQAQLLTVNRQRIEISADGHLHDAGVDIGLIDAQCPHDPRAQALRDVALAVTRAVPGLRGFVGIDVVWHAQRGPVVIEVNPRVTCAYVGLSALLGRNLASEVLAAHGAAQQGLSRGQSEPVDAVA